MSRAPRPAAPGSWGWGREMASTAPQRPLLTVGGKKEGLSPGEPLTLGSLALGLSAQDPGTRGEEVAAEREMQVHQGPPWVQEPLLRIPAKRRGPQDHACL